MKRLSIIVTAVLIALTLNVFAGEAIEPVPIGFDALTAFDKLPLLTDYPAFQDSSYSREHKNADSNNFIRIEENGEKVMVDTDGPGCIYRIWSTGVTGAHLSPDNRVKFYFDNEPNPRLDIAASELFGDRGAKFPFVQPLSRTFESGRGDMEGPASICYVPIPFAKHIKITTTGLQFYHVGYLKYPAGTPIESFSMALAEKNRPILDKAAAMFLASGQMPAPPTEPMLTSEKSIDIAPGQTGVLYDATGAGVVRALKVKLHRSTNLNNRGLVLQIQYDGAPVNSVNSPIGDFFGAMPGSNYYKSTPMGTSPDGYYSYFPMPYRKGIKILVRNDTKEPARIFATVMTQKMDAIPTNAGYFHASYRQDKEVPFRVDYNILDISGGKGKFVGTHMFMQGAKGTEMICHLEGDEAIYVDEETTWPPRWVGTGTEDYFNGSFYWNGVHPEEMAQPFGGLTVRHDGMRRTNAYRWQITDCVNFNQRVKVDMQHGPESDWPSDYASVAYWYMDKPVPAPELPSLADRIPRSELPAPIMMGCRFEGEFTSKGAPVEVRHLRTVDPEFYTDVMPEGLAPKRMQIFCSAKEIGQDITGKLFVPGEDHYKSTVFLSAGPNYGKVGVYIDGKNIMNINAYNETFLPAKGFDLGTIRLTSGAHELKFVMLGQDVMATAMDFGLVAFHASPISAVTVQKWQIIGPFPSQRQTGWQTEHQPEKEQDITKTYEIDFPRGDKTEKLTVKWQPIVLPPGGGVPSYHYYGWGSDQCCYGLTYIWSPKEQTVGAFIAKDDAIAIWVNDQKVLDDNTWSMYLGDQLIAACPLKQGWNKMLVKNGNWDGCWAFAIRMNDPAQELKFSNEPPKPGE